MMQRNQPTINGNFYLNYQQREYLQTCMAQVSRTFALVTPCFEEPLDERNRFSEPKI
ncbi:MAG: hypothetical protein V7K21_29400 [Nostoc sp.]|uniref:hypothetical protein n=1 Tax=Nostoc sp. TaxID=1180 RepID=UPI002FF94F01